MKFQVSLVIEAENASVAVSHFIWNDYAEVPEYKIYEIEAREVED